MHAQSRASRGGGRGRREVSIFPKYPARYGNPSRVVNLLDTFCRLHRQITLFRQLGALRIAIYRPSVVFTPIWKHTPLSLAPSPPLPWSRYHFLRQSSALQVASCVPWSTHHQVCGVKPRFRSFLLFQGGSGSRWSQLNVESVVPFAGT